MRANSSDAQKPLAHFIIPEESLIKKIDWALASLERIKFNAHQKKDKESMRDLLSNARTAIAKVQQDYQDQQTPEYNVTLNNKWDELNSHIIQLKEELREIQAITENYTQHIHSSETRKAMMAEFLTGISADVDGGAAQNAALVTASTNTTMQFVPRPGETLPDLTNAKVVEDVKRAVGETFQAEVARLRKDGDPDVARMQQNQNIAVARCIENFTTVDEKIKNATVIQDAIASALEDFDGLMNQCDLTKEDERFDALVDILDPLILEIHAIQNKIKHRRDDFGLAALMNEIQFGAKELSKEFKKMQVTLRLLSKNSNRNADVQSALSGTMASTASSFFSRSSYRSRENSSNSSSSANTDSESGSEDSLPRKRARIG